MQLHFTARDYYLICVNVYRDHSQIKLYAGSSFAFSSFFILRILILIQVLQHFTPSFPSRAILSAIPHFSCFRSSLFALYGNSIWVLVFIGMMYKFLKNRVAFVLFVTPVESNFDNKLHIYHLEKKFHHISRKTSTPGHTSIPTSKQTGLGPSTSIAFSRP